MSEHKEEKANGNLMMTLAGFIVDKRNLIFLLVIIGFIFSAFSTGWIEVENDLKEFLPDWILLCSLNDQSMSLPFDAKILCFGCNQLLLL